MIYVLIILGLFGLLMMIAILNVSGDESERERQEELKRKLDEYNLTEGDEYNSET